MTLHVEVHGAGPPLVVLHGFTQTARLWGPMGDALAGSFTLIGIDLPGHGGSGEVRADMPTTAALVAEAAGVATEGEACDLLGYSLGARVALQVLCDGELEIRRSVLIGGTAGIEDPIQREARRARDDAMAEALESSGDVAGFLARWLAAPMFSRLGGAAQIEERGRNGAGGLALSLRLAGTGAQEPIWGRLASVHTPVLALAGSDDERFAAHALRLARELPMAAASLVPGGGHAVHLAQPAPTTRLVRHWLTVTGSPPQSPQ